LFAGVRSKPQESGPTLEQQVQWDKEEETPQTNTGNESERRIFTIEKQ